MPPSSPEVIGKYTIQRWIESGGMGDIYLALDPSLDRPVAIKLLREGFDSEDLRERFEREARAAGRLSHPNIVTVYEFGEYDGRPFIAMEYVPGESLAKLIRRRHAIPLTQRLEMMEGLCAGLAHAHRAGIVHRDIKPANLMVDGEGGIKVLDFGIVRMAGSGLTHQGVLVGTVNYMSPEQIAGSGFIDHRSDVFAVGTVCYELFALKRAFPGEMAEVLYKIVHADPEPLASLCPGLDPAIERAVHRCLEKSPDRRYQDLTHLKRDLARIRQRLELEADSSATIVPRDVAVQGPPPPPDTVSPILGEAQAALDAQDLDRAVALAERAFALAPEDARAKQILEKAQRTRQSRALAGALNRAQSALSRKDFAGARQAVDEALGADPENAVALGVQREVENALSELRRLEAHERAALEAIAQARRLFDADRHAEALDRLERFAPPHPQVTHALAGLRARQDELERARKVRDARVHRVHELLAAARKALAGDDLDRAQAAVQEAAALDADVTQIAVVRKAVEDRTRDLQRLAQWLRDGETLLGRGELQGAMQLVQEALRVRPGDPAATALGGRVQQALDERRIEDERRRAEEARQRQIEAWLEEARAAPDDEQAMALLDRIFEVAPAHGDARRLLDDVRRRQEERLSARRDRVGQGKKAADEGRFAEALAILRPLAKESAQDSGFAQLMQQVEAGAARAEAERRLQEKQTATLQEAADKAARDEFAAARALIQSILAQQPTHQRARALLGEVLKGEEQLTRARGSVEKALALFERGDHGDAIGLLAGVTPPHPLVAATLTQLRTRLAEIERARRRAEQRQQYSRTVRSMGAMLRSLTLDRRLQLLLVVTLASVAAWRYWPEQGPPQGPRHASDLVLRQQPAATPPQTNASGAAEPSRATDQGAAPAPGASARDADQRSAPPKEPLVVKLPAAGNAVPARVDPVSRPQSEGDAATKLPDTRQPETRPAETKLPDTRVPEARPPDTAPRPADTVAPEPKPAETRPADPPPAAERREPEPAPKPVTPTGPSPQELARRDVQNWLGEYARTYATLDESAIRRLNPEAAQAFSRTKALVDSVTVSFDNVRVEVTNDGQGAFLLAQVAYQYKWKRSGLPPSRSENIRWTLRRNGSSWVVAQ